MERKRIFRLLNATIPKAMFMGFTAVVATLVLYIVQKNGLKRSLFSKTDITDNKIFEVYSYALGVLLVFRNGQAYSRWWDGAQELRVATKQWHDACAQLIASSVTSKADEEKIHVFHHVVVRLFSILQCSALQYIADMEDEEFEILNTHGLGEDTLNGLECCQGDPKERMCMVFQWIMNAIYRNLADGVISAPPPIVSRVFHEMNLGALKFERMATISATSFPNPYAHMISILLAVHMFYTAIVISTLVSEPGWVCVSSFCAVFCYWCINFIAIEIEHPFGDDVNDLPVRELQEESNHYLKMLLNERFQHVPGQFHMDFRPSLQEMKIGMAKPARMSQSRGLGAAGSNDKYMSATLGVTREFCSSVDTPAMSATRSQESQPATLVLPIPTVANPQKALPAEPQPDAKLKEFSGTPAPPMGADAIVALEKLASVGERLSQSQSEIVGLCKEIRNALNILVVRAGGRGDGLTGFHDFSSQYANSAVPKDNAGRQVSGPCACSGC